MPSIDPYSTCSVYIQSLFDEHELGIATGFFVKVENDIFLVSNWHVFSGRDPASGQPKNKHGAVPNRISIHYLLKENINQYLSVTVSLESDIGALWIQHKIGQKIDVSLMSFQNIERQIDRSTVPGADLTPVCINELPTTSDMSMPVGADVFVLGYPYGITRTGLLPIWKRASIATEFALDVDGLPCFLVDTATREGMSGAPVVRRSFNAYTDVHGNGHIDPGVYNKFLGVYSGRRVGGLDEAQLGVIWKESVITQIVNDPMPGNFMLYS